MNDSYIDRFNELVAAFESRPGWFPYVRVLKDIPPIRRDLGHQMLEWAEQSLGESWPTILAEGYVAFVSDVNRSQIRYEITGKYKHNNYSDVYQSVYGNEEFMRYYHWGVFVSTFAWSHHHDIVMFFKERFVKTHLTVGNAKSILDLGCGSGIWSFLSLASSSYLTSTGVDISETSVRHTIEMSNAIGFGKRFRVQCGDANAWGKSEHSVYDGGVSCFLLEHLENPVDLLINLSRLIKPRGVAFVTCALTAAETDHIKEFRRESELIEMAERAGFRVMEMLVASPPGHRSDARFLPRSLAMILSKRVGEVW